MSSLPPHQSVMSADLEGLIFCCCSTLFCESPTDFMSIIKGIMPAHYTQYGGSPIGSFNPAIPTKIFPQSRNPDGFYQLIPIPATFFLSPLPQRKPESFMSHLASKQRQVLPISCISFHQNDDIFHSWVFTVSNELRKSKLFLFFTFFFCPFLIIFLVLPLLRGNPPYHFEDL